MEMYEDNLNSFALASDSVLDPNTPNQDNTNENDIGNVDNKNDKEKSGEGAAIAETGEAAEAPTPPPASTPPPAGAPKPNVQKSEWVDILGNGELKMKLLKRGKRNTRPQSGDICDVKILGKLEDGNIVEKFDQVKVQIGDHEVVRGLELALQLMNVGEKAIVIVGPRFAYGELGNPPNIPPNATIKYVIELFMAEMEAPLENIPHDLRMTLATSKRERGNWWYTRQEASKAVQCYKKAADLLDETIPYVTPEGQVIENAKEKIKIVMREKIKVFNNLAAAQLIVEAYDSALMSVGEVLKHEPNNVKALFRKSKILSAQGSVTEALVPLRQASLVEPGNTAVLSELYKCLRLAEIEKRDEKILYRKMLGQTATLAEEKPREKTAVKPSRYHWNKIWGTAATATIMFIIAAALGYKFKNYSFL